MALEFDAFHDRTIREHNDRTYVAWRTANLVRARKFPELQTMQVSARRRRRTPQSTEHMKTIAKMWTRRMGGTVAARKRD